MPKQVIDGYVVANHYGWQGPDEVSWSFQTWKSSHASVLYSFPHSFEVEVPTVNVVALEVEQLEAQKSLALAEYQARVAEINERLSKLQALTNEVVS